jgi:hypothetical protein
MFKGQFKEAHDRATDLVDTNCQIFEDAIRWMYSGELGKTTEHLADQIGDDEMIDGPRSPAQGEEGDHENCRFRASSTLITVFRTTLSTLVVGINTMFRNFSSKP